MTHVLSTINLKGGVGKTTTTVALAEFLSAEMQKDVLVIDLDPQTNATVMLIGEKKWKKLNKNGHTIANLFNDALDPENRRFDLEKTIQKNVSNVSGANTVDLIPSSLDLIYLQDRLPTMPSGRFHANSPVDVLRKAVKRRLGNYDVVIIDCPPNLGIITLNGLRISERYLIPTIPDILSTYGIPQIRSRVKEFSKEIAEDITPLGIVITKYQANSRVHNSTEKDLRNNKDYVVFDTVIQQANQFSSAAENVGQATLKQKWGYGGLADRFSSLAKELMRKLEQ